MEEIKIEEIGEILKGRIKGYEREIVTSEVGTVISVGDGIARAYGLSEAMAGELVEFQSGIMGLVLNLEEDNVGIAIFGEDKYVEEGNSVVASTIDFTIWFYLLKKLDTSTVTVSVMLVPVLGLFFDWLQLGKRLDIGIIVGGILILAGIYQVSKYQK